MDCLVFGLVIPVVENHRGRIKRFVIGLLPLRYGQHNLLTMVQIFVIGHLENRFKCF